MSHRRRAPFVALTILLRRRFPDVDDPADLIRRGVVLVDGAPVANPRAQVRSDASIRRLRERPLRGTVKLGHALGVLGVDVRGRAALDLGAAAGGFTRALLDAGARRVYAVDVGFGQLCGTLRSDPRVVTLERTNLAHLSAAVAPDPIDVVAMDLSYLSVADALPQIDRALLAPGAVVVALVKPTYELGAPVLADRPEDVADALAIVDKALARTGWQRLGCTPSSIPGANGAVEIFVAARHTG